MTKTNTCPKCTAPLPSNAPGGICPKCLMGAGLEIAVESHKPSGASDLARTTPQSDHFIPPEPSSLAPHFPQLEIGELLGHGGMGAVYKARQAKLDRPVALKIIRPESAGDPAFAERFNREARTLARLNHPNIVAVHDFGEVILADPTGDDAKSRTLYYFLMEFVDGANLRQLIHAGEYPFESALTIIPQICEALQFAHDDGIVHRDIKPENILVDTKGRAKIADFGLARLVESSPQDLTLTGTNQVMGTPRYMAPEQMASSRGVDHRADIYSLGVVLYEMLTGELPVGRFEPPSKKADVDGRLDEVVLRALAKEPERRFQQASEMRSSVEYISSHAEPPLNSGVSTIIKRELLDCWKWIAGDVDRTAAKRPRFPRVLMILMSLLGGLMFLFPWLDLEIDRLTSLEGVAVTLEKPVSRTLDGYECWSGIATGLAFAASCLLLALTSARDRVTVLQTVSLTGIAAFALALTLLFRVELGYRTFPVEFELLDGESKELTGQEYWPAYLSAIEHRITYRAGFFGSLGLSAGLLLLSASGISHAVRDREFRKGSDQSADPPLTSLRFRIPADQDVGAQIVFLFSGLGYRSMEVKPNKWIFERGSRWGGFWCTDIRAFHTRLTVSTAPGQQGELLVSCVWAVRTLGAWIGRRDIKELEAEGQEFASLLGCIPDEMPASTESNTPRYSITAMVAAVLYHVLIVVFVVGTLVVWQNRQWLVTPIDWLPLLIYPSVFGIVGSITTLVGIVSISAIRTSNGALKGIGLAFSAAVLFPLLLLDVIIYVSCLLAVDRLSSFSTSTTAFLAAILVIPLWVLADIPLLHFTWRFVWRSPNENSNLPTLMEHGQVSK